MRDCYALEVAHRRRVAARCGSYPYRYIAEDFDLPYDVVLNYADGVKAALVLDGLSIKMLPVPAFGYWQHQAYLYVLAHLPGAVLDRFEKRIASLVHSEVKGHG